MRIGVMLRDIGNQTDAPGIIVLNLMDEILRQDRENEYVLFYRNESFIDRYAHYPNVTIRLVESRSKLLWDQLSIPLAVLKSGIDLLFHPKHSIPLLVSCKCIMQLRGPEYWINPEYYDWYDLLYQKTALRLFSRKATHIIAESGYAKHEFQKYLKIPDSKISVCYLAASNRFMPVNNMDAVDEIRGKYKLPDKYILTVTRVIQGRKWYGGKNLERMLAAFGEADVDADMKFVIIGRQTRKYVSENVRDDALIKRLHVLDFVEQADLPVIYSQALLFLFTSLNESFGIPIVEAMRCGCPVITSATTACGEIGHDSAFLVNPESESEICAAMEKLARQKNIRESYSEKGLLRANEFTWSSAASRTIELFGKAISS
jgi:glycosyltransferase involved in cell wall biosynthesis